VGEAPQSPPICTDKIAYAKIMVCAILSLYFNDKNFKTKLKKIKSDAPYLPMIKSLYTIYSLLIFLKTCEHLS
jgi:hypothetical protein